MPAHRKLQLLCNPLASGRAIGGLLGSLLLCVAACEPPASPWQPPNILLISVDTLRADRLSIYGHDRATTPRIAELAQQSAIFDRAYTQAPHTLAAHTSLMTGLYPGRHGVFYKGNSLSESEVTLAEVLSAQGYRSVAIVNALYLAPEFRGDRGFEVYDYAHDVHVARNAEQSNERILEELAQPSEQPFFLFAHYFDAHSDWDGPYEAPEAYVDEFAGAPPPGYRLGGGRRFASRQMLALNRSGRQLSPPERAYLAQLYDAGVAYTDHQVGALLDALQRSGKLQRTIVILISDHGEEFQDHGELLHAQVYEELVRIPLLVSMPEMRGASGPTCRPRPKATGPPRAGRVADVVQLVDVFTTITDCLGIDPPERVQGTSFLPPLSGGPGSREWAYFESPQGQQRGILRGHWKLVEFRDRPPKLFDLARDPRERTDLSAEHPERVRELARELARYQHQNRVSRSSGDAFEVPREIEKALEALGYAGPHAEEPTPGPPDPVE